MFWDEEKFLSSNEMDRDIVYFPHPCEETAGMVARRSSHQQAVGMDREA